MGKEEMFALDRCLCTEGLTVMVSVVAVLLLSGVSIVMSVVFGCFGAVIIHRIVPRLRPPARCSAAAVAPAERDECKERVECDVPVEQVEKEQVEEEQVEKEEEEEECSEEEAAQMALID